MQRTALISLPLLCLFAAAPARAQQVLHFFAGGNPGFLSSAYPSQHDSSDDPWAGLVMGTSVFGVSGSGKYSRGGFGGETYIGYSRELDNNFIIGVSGQAGYLPGLWKYGPSGYGFGMANITVGYDMGQFVPYVDFGIGRVSALNGFHGAPGGLNTVNAIFGPSSGSTTLTHVGAGFDYAVNNNIHIGVHVEAYKANGDFGPPMPPQPGQSPIMP